MEELDAGKTEFGRIAVGESGWVEGTALGAEE